ncbi:hypothetical protein ERO13_D05G277400v2 [Gossypium hirsutum]|uniref:Uncharacterized protein n=3 Tax=Gossypium TaxID=3633 RepID=A0A1U8JF28_GOSHI|nr:uncharacterized protein LOC107904876 [Gossypium hirsutum]KAB2031240.1 hypothetical protein ES319_D05G291400v1 [Gossypium barbadense]KAG4148292.1 hypothetical protein ERO13_D05G277400v2 [Gossypium hirsutum]PPD87782.1 hypothetical protein GOBAR_DD15266 [Gossypium barbadense]TYG70359.1 hypothetical protein ES288_D05G307000v1 [Gossypium darwinii]
MGSSSTQFGHHHQTSAKECGPIIPATKSPWLSSSLRSTYFPDDSPLSPATPFRFSGVPFSWEQLPGIPKKLHNHNNRKESMKLLPLPPPTTPRTSSKTYSFEDMLSRKKASAGASESFRRVDPFFAALVECSKEDHDGDEETARNLWTGGKVTRSMSDRLGFINLYTSCKRSCAVSESIVYLPRSRRSADYGLISNRRPR